MTVEGVVRAAGGLVCRAGRGGRLEIAVIHRPAYDDWTLPKGKLQNGEREEDAALREVHEETGLRCRLEEPLLSTRYVDRHGRPKVVSYFKMSRLQGRFRPNREVDELRWLTPTEANAVLTYPHDRALIAQVHEEV